MPAVISRVESPTSAFNIVSSSIQIDGTNVIDSSRNWSGNAIAANKGGTGQTSYSSGDILYASGSTTLSKLAKGTDGQVLKLASGLPTWSSDIGSVTTLASNELNLSPANATAFVKLFDITGVTLTSPGVIGSFYVKKYEYLSTSVNTWGSTLLRGYFRTATDSLSQNQLKFEVEVLEGNGAFSITANPPVPKLALKKINDSTYEVWWRETLISNGQVIPHKFELADEVNLGSFTITKAANLSGWTSTDPTITTSEFRAETPTTGIIGIFTNRAAIGTSTPSATYALTVSGSTNTSNGFYDNGTQITNGSGEIS